ncbi:hypothetical protein CCAX7_52150 [Capsulimonas corticalis]|uniref:Uncharacterized protein n=1 Tax=Capsulimonas corticalis TaxID=2219043 RepID=A0A402CP02_9BACT|nr:hypothetical protein [Capsulimonas corticalis]BDI33164.1 hypothetical protein CCAX7_52150 [Capsulimonas corticalis]
MDSETKTVFQFLHAYSQARAELRGLLSWLLKRPSVKEARLYDSPPRSFERKSRDGDRQHSLVIFSASVSANFTDGSDAEWRFEVECDGADWTVEHSVSRRGPDEELMTTVVDFEEWTSESLDELIAHLPQVVDDLRASVETPGVLPSLIA